jgi:hypothetical protein
MDKTKRWTYPDFNYTFVQEFTGSDGTTMTAQVTNGASFNSFFVLFVLFVSLFVC